MKTKDEEGNRVGESGRERKKRRIIPSIPLFYLIKKGEEIEREEINSLLPHSLISFN